MKLIKGVKGKVLKEYPQGKERATYFGWGNMGRCHGDALVEVCSLIRVLI